MSKHTPGPWATRDGTDIVGFDNCKLASTAWSAHPERENEANARLIAAAPELLDAAKSWLNDDIDDGEYSDKLRLIIARLGA